MDVFHRSPDFHSGYYAAATGGRSTSTTCHEFAADRPFRHRTGRAPDRDSRDLLGATSLTTFGVRYLASQRRFSSDDLLKVCRELDKHLIPYRIDDQRRVEVSADQFEEAAALVAKLDLGQHSIDEIRGDSSTWSLWESTEEREHKELLRCERMIERLIGEQEGVVSTWVSINRPHASLIKRVSSKPSAFVYIETEGGRALPSRTVQTIPVILTGYVPELTPGSITVMDHRGKKYLEPGNPTLGDSSRNRAREEEISEEILEKLDWIKGVRVAVQVVPQGTADSASEPAQRPGRLEAVGHGRSDPAGRHWPWTSCNPIADAFADDPSQPAAGPIGARARGSPPPAAGCTACYRVAGRRREYHANRASRRILT